MMKTILTPFFSMAAFSLFSNKLLIIGYPPIPWLGIMLAGFATGKYFEWVDLKRKKLFLQIGLIALLIFVVIRAINIYGDPVRWASQKNNLYTALSFMNITKYPPSLLFCLVTLGIMFLALGFSSGIKNKFADFVSVYGKVPLFYFLVHFFLIHFIMLGILLLQGFHWSQMEFATGNFGRPKGVESGLPLWSVYLIWMGVVLVLYKPCQWFGRYKATHTQWWLRYL